MAKYVPIAPSDASKVLFDALANGLKTYAVTWFTPASLRAIYGLYKSARAAFTACKQAKLRNPLAHAACYLLVGSSYFFVDNGGEFHP